MAAERSRTRKITVSVPAALVEFVDTKAARVGSSRSQVISDCLTRAQEMEREELAAEGYGYYADEAAEFARASATMAARAAGSPAIT